MNETPAAARRFAVIGGGISGLAAAHRLRQLAPAVEVVVFEAGTRLGGVLLTEQRDGYLLEHSADNFISNVPWATDLCRQVGLGEQLLSTNEAERRALIVHRGQLYPVPAGFTLLSPGQWWPIVTTPLLSLRGKLRLLSEWLVPRRREAGDESLASFARRRLGREAFERIVQPLVGGIYTADAERLSLAATLPRFLDMEREHGSLMRAAWQAARKTKTATKAESGARYSMFLAPRDGMSSLVAAIAAQLPAGSIRLNTRIENITPAGQGSWTIQSATSTTNNSGRSSTEAATFTGVIIATPAPVTGRLLQTVDPQLAAELAQIPYAGSAIALVGCRREQLGRPLTGFGFVVPEIERRDIIAVSYSSQKFVGRAPADRVLLRVFMGGAARPDLLNQPDEALRRIVERELSELLDLRGAPELFQVTRWAGAMPQYHLGHLDRVARIEQRVKELPNLALAGNAYRGVGIPHCIESGRLAAEQLLHARPQAV